MIATEKPRILVIEDEPQIRENLTWLLEAGGYETLTAPDGQRGIERALSEHPDLILCDVMMPGADGFEVLRRVRACPETALTPFLVLTARAAREDLRAAMAAGADDYITKPFAAHDVLEAVAARLEKQATLEEKQEARLAQLRTSISQALPHEFRTPLTAVIGFSQVLLDEWGHVSLEEAREMVRHVHEAGCRLERTVENYSFFAHLELLASDAELLAKLQQAPTTDAASCVEDVARQVAAKYARLGDLRLGIEACSVAVQEPYLVKATYELVDNAFKFSDPSAPVAVRLRMHEAAAVLEVLDRGRGMSSGDARRVAAFLQFGRATHEDQGSGLGLVIARRIAELHGGTMHLDSQPGVGTRVELRGLPTYNAYWGSAGRC